MLAVLIKWIWISLIGTLILKKIVIEFNSKFKLNFTLNDIVWFRVRHFVLYFV